MAWRENRRRTPLYGGLLIVAAMLAGLLVSQLDVATPLRVVVYLVALVAALAGVLMTLRDQF